MIQEVAERSKLFERLSDPDAAQSLQGAIEEAFDLGRALGLEVNVISKLCTNQFHGSLLEFVRNDDDAFDAKDFFDSHSAPIPRFHQNQFGGAGGGPLIKKRTFFFLSYEGQRVRKSLTQTFSVLTEAMRKGDFSGLPTIYEPQSASTEGDACRSSTT